MAASGATARRTPRAGPAGSGARRKCVEKLDSDQLVCIIRLVTATKRESGTREVVVAGVGMTRFARQPESTLKELTGEAVAGALQDAQLPLKAVEAAFFANAIGGSITGQEMIAGQVALRALGVEGIPIVNVENACASGSTALHLGWQAVAAGAADCVLCVGVEKMSHPDKRVTFEAIGRAVDVEQILDGEDPDQGSRSYFMDLYAGQARRRMEASDVSQADLAAVVVKNRAHGALNPRAQFTQAITLEQVLEAREIVWPLTLPMCSPVSDGAAAVLLVARDPSRPTAGREVRIAASVLASGSGGDSTARASSKAYALAGVGPEDLDLVELHDAAAPAELSIYESLGLAAAGDGARLIRDGSTRLGSALPVNPSGGLLSKGHPIGATGLAQAFEVVTQLRGEAGDRQVDGARWALAQNGGGWIDDDNAAVAIHIFEGANA
jgi:acetyl-CoA acetyltransferase